VFEDPNFERHEYDRWSAYGQSKTANILFALDEPGEAEGVRAFSLYPGGIARTGLEKYVSRKELRAGGIVDENGKPIIDPERGLKTVEQGAATSVWCATSPQLDGMGGAYCQDCDIAPMVRMGVEVNRQVGSIALRVMSFAIDPEAAGRLWSLSEQLVFGGQR
jgi:NAD(P)-dependent dehydrogenase (short-subunit alcohol dehydrogenase family)